jgi:beta-glucosidase
MSDGPAGIRITNSYVKYDLLSGSEAYDATQTYYTATYNWSGNTYHEIEIADEAAYKAELEKGTNLYVTDGSTYYQYCTAFPIGTLLAQTWDPDVVEKVGRAIGVEMLEYGVTSFLAPGMNIHRNPLCGRNFEYYSEDPVVAGLTAAAETKGVETNADGSESGVGVTLKHFAFNDQENSRMGSNSVVSERAAREIYLKGFEIAVKKSQPDYIMSSYNMVNGTSTFENYGLLTEMLRNEWGFEGFVMTDWYSVWGVKGMNSGKNVQALLMYAGNDCEMPGSDEASILSALEDGSIMRLGDLQRSAINMLNVIKRSAVFDIMKSKLDASKDTTIADLQDKVTEAEKKVENLTNSISASGSVSSSTSSATEAELKKAQEELASVKAELEAAQKEAASASKVTIVTDKSSYTVKKGKTVKITAVSSNGKKVTFTSNNKKIAKVTSKGKVTGVKKGSTKIVIKVGSVKKTVKVTVK